MLCHHFIVGASALIQKRRMFFIAAKVSILKSLLCVSNLAIRETGSGKWGPSVLGCQIWQRSTNTFDFTHDQRRLIYWKYQFQNYISTTYRVRIYEHPFCSWQQVLYVWTIQNCVDLVRLHTGMVIARNQTSCQTSIINNNTQISFPSLLGLLWGKRKTTVQGSVTKNDTFPAETRPSPQRCCHPLG